MRVAVLDDDRAQTELVAGILARAGFQADVFNAGRQLLARMRTDTFDMLIVDWNMPSMSGIEVLRAVRQGNHAAMPVLMITSRADEADVVEGLGAGADDYLVKPVSEPVLLARVQAALRRAGLNNPVKQYDFGTHRFEGATDTVTMNAAPVKLTSKEYALALLLFENAGRPLSRSYLLEAVWGASPEAETRTLDAHVSRIRTKLNLRPAGGWRLAPVYSFGYRLEKVEAGAADA
jgi:DNA-binding response OmpR family regulator